MEQVPQADELPVGERSVEQATRKSRSGVQIPGGAAGFAPPLAFRVPEHLDVVDSTNRYLADLVREGLSDGAEVPEGYAVVAEEQSAGRGRLERTWQAPPGSGLLCSIFFRPDLAADELHLTAWAVALAAVSACRETAGIEIALKWPNDLLAATELVSRPGGEAAGSNGAGGEARKVGGMLSEVLGRTLGTAPGNSRGPGGVVVGIGINVNWPCGWPPEETDDEDLASIAATATALNRLAGREIDRWDLARRLLGHAGEENAELGTTPGRRRVASRYRLACSTIGRKVRVQLADESVLGTAVDLDDSGQLVVSTETCLRTISAGDVVHLR
jgi:BirA family biotin operon repressor/biotin-[acetyl-CoA-carboxylase] ligase